MAWLDSIAANSLGIYILHQFVGKYTLMYYVPGFVELYDKHYVLVPVCLFVFMFLMAWLTSFILHKFRAGRFLLGS